MTESSLPIRRALLSVSDKSGLVEFARFLSGQGVELLSTGGSARSLRESGLVVREVAEVTEFPEIMDGRVKTLHPRIHGGLLGRRDNAEDRAAMETHGIPEIDLLVVNLYPFGQTVASGAGRADCVEKIDIGGPAMVRAAAKNHAFVAVVTNPEDYETVWEEMQAGGGALSFATRRRLAADAFAHTAAYDAAVSGWMAEQEGQSFPRELSLAGRRRQVLRYGENPHQNAAFYTSVGRDAARPGVATAAQLQGKELSYNNLNDTDAAFEAVAEFDDPAIVIVKHANPCGVAVAEGLAEAYRKALACDPVSAYGGIIAANRTLDADVAEMVADLFAEVVIAPEITEAARRVFEKKANLRLLATGGMPDPAASGLTAKTLAGGLLVQDRDGGRLAEADLRTVTKRAPSPQEVSDMLFAFRVAKHVKSNAIVYAKDGATVGIGAGQMSRVDSARIAVSKAAEAAGESKPRTEGAVVASDAFFPFADGLLAAADAGVSAVIQPGGSMRDEAVIQAADEKGLAMVFTGMRHFRH